MSTRDRHKATKEIPLSLFSGSQATKTRRSETTHWKSRTNRPHAPTRDDNVLVCMVAVPGNPTLGKLGQDCCDFNTSLLHRPSFTIAGTS